MTNSRTEPDDTPPVPFHTSRLSRRQKAAIIVRFLLNEGAEVRVSDLPETQQRDLTHMMGSMHYVDRETLAAVVREFAQEIETVGLSFPHGLSGALDVLDGRINPLTAARLRKEAGVRAAGDPWERIRALDPHALLTLMDGESADIASVILSKLEVTKAAELLQLLPGDKARGITYAVSRTRSVTPAAVDCIGLTLASQIDDCPPTAFSDAPDSRVGAILNFSPATNRDALLTGLEEADQGFADLVRKAIFTFADIPARLTPTDVSRALRDVSHEQLITAVAASAESPLAAVSDYLLSNMSMRLADQIREDAEERGAVSEIKGDTAMTAVVSAIKTMADAGDITLIYPE